MTPLTRQEILRYSRHLIMPEVGLEGQEKLKGAKVLIVGLGGLGSPAALYLAAAGVGTLGLVDGDEVDFTNLQRQIIHGTPDAGEPKLASAKTKIQAINPEVDVVLHETFLQSANAMEIIESYDVVIDGTDNFPTRYLVNDACVLLGKPNCYGSIFRFEGQASVFHHAGGPCYRCLYPEPPPPGLVPSCAEGGVLGVLPGIIGVIQATEAIKILLGQGETLAGRLLLYDALGMRFQELKIRRDPNCPVCGDHPTVHGLIDYLQFCGVPGISGFVRTYAEEISPENLHSLLQSGDDIQLLDVREPHEFAINRLEGALLIPLGDLPKRLAELDRTKKLVAYCLVGSRSADACELLHAAGFGSVANLTGGIRAWGARIDSTMPQY